MAKKSPKRGAKPAAPPAAEPTTEPDRPEAGRSMERLHIWQIQAVRDLMLLASVIGLVWAGHALRAVTVPLLVALLLAYLFEPLVQRLTARKRLSRTGAVGSLLAVLGMLVLLLVLVLLPVVVGQTGQFIGSVRDGTFYARVEALREWVPEAYGTTFDAVMERWKGEDVGTETGTETETETGTGTEAGTETETGTGTGTGTETGTGTGTGTETETDTDTGTGTDADTGESLDARIERIVDAQIAAQGDSGSGGGGTDWLGLARGTLSTTFDIVGSIVSFGLLLFLIPFYFFFFSVWYPDVVAFGRELIPRKNHQRTLDLLAHMDQVVAGFVRGRIVISAIMGVMLAIGWQICGVPYAVPLGLLIGVFCAVPYLGGIGVPLACGLALLSWLEVDPRGPLWAVFAWPILVFVIVQLIEGYVLVPLIAGKATNLDPVTILVAVLAGGSILGMYGMLLAIPAVACAKILFLEVLMPRIQAWIRGEIADPIPIERD